MDNSPPPPPLQPQQPQQQLQQQPLTQPQPQPLSIRPPPFIHNPFPPPTTPSSSSSTASHRKKRRSKLLRIDTTTTNTTLAMSPPNKYPSGKEITPPPCTECGKTFWSWKALFGHMRCHPERQWRGINPPPHLRRGTLPPTPTPTSPPTPATSDDREVAASLLLLANSPEVATARFECSSCKKTFGSHQALGGHRASHKNVKGCFAITKSSTDVEEDHNFMIMQSGLSHDEGLGLGLSLGLGFGVGHKCGLCLKVFPTGQALGGHMRCHWEKSEEASPSSIGLALGPLSTSNEAQSGLDLNLPAKLQDQGASSSVNPSNSMQLELRLGI